MGVGKGLHLGLKLVLLSWMHSFYTDIFKLFYYEFVYAG